MPETCPSAARPGAPRAWTVLLVASLLGAAGCAHDEPRHAETRSPVAVAVETAVESAWPAGPEVSAAVEPLRRAAPGTVLLGRVDAVLRDVGDRVREGEVLARVESREVSARLAQAEAAVAAARAAERNAERMRDRMVRLHERDAASQRNVDDAVAGWEAAVAQRRAAEEGVAAARMYVSYAEVRAPFAGVVTERHVETGDTAAPGVPLFTVEDLSRVKVEAAVAETAARLISPGDAAELEVPAAAIRPTGSVTEVLPSADPRSRTVTVRLLVDNPDGALRSGMYARVRLGGAEQPVLTVPAASAVERGALRGLFVVGDDGRARLRWVTLGEERDGRVAVLTGLRAGERVVVAPPASLIDGAPVEVR